MSTRSLTIIQDADKREIMVLHRQSDGYPEGHGKELANFLCGMVVGNGIPLHYPPRFANGMPCLAAQLVKHFKDGVGGIYLYPSKTRDCGEEYLYTVKLHYGKLYLVVQEVLYGTKGYKRIFKGTPEEFLTFVESNKEVA